MPAQPAIYLFIYLFILQMYVELFGPDGLPADQPPTVPNMVHINVRHLSNCYFLAGDNEIKQYRQPVGNYRDLKFNRFSISNGKKCRESKANGQSSCKEFNITPLLRARCIAEHSDYLSTCSTCRLSATCCVNGQRA